MGHLQKLAAESKGKLVLFKADLLSQGAYTEAMQGCELVYHTASPFKTDVKDAQKELIDPALLGTANVLQSANAVASVKRVVVTSSLAAIYTDTIECTKAPGGVLTEAIWNTTASLDYQPYSLSKTVAERKAWEMAGQQQRWDLVTVNMGLVLGPDLNAKNTTTESATILKMYGDGQMKMGAPKLAFGVVDVRDVALAHFKAGFTPEANGRYITVAGNSDLVALGAMLLPKYGKRFPIPKGALPKWLLLIVGPMVNKLFSRRFIQNNINWPMHADNSKIKKELGMTFRPLQETMEDSFQVLVDAGIVKGK